MIGKVYLIIMPSPLNDIFKNTTLNDFNTKLIVKKPMVSFPGYASALGHLSLDFDKYLLVMFNFSRHQQIHLSIKHK